MRKPEEPASPGPIPLPANQRPYQLLSYVALVAILCFFGYIRLRLLSMPLERDEGEYAYAGQLILRGIAPYTLCYTMKLPGVATSYALFMTLFGQTDAAIHLGLLAFNSAANVMLFLLARRLFGPLEAVLASASFALLSLDPSVMGLAAHATQFALLPLLLGSWWLLDAMEQQRMSRFYISGLMFGMAILMKQPCFFFAIFALIHLGCRGFPLRHALRRQGVLLAGVATPYLALCLILLVTGEFGPFWYWTFTYARAYVTGTPLHDALRPLTSTLYGQAVTHPVIWFFAMLGLSNAMMSHQPRMRRVFLRTFAACSFLAVCPGFYFRQHYYVLLLPAVALLCAVTISTARRARIKAGASWVKSHSFLLIYCLLFCFSLAGRAPLYFILAPQDVSSAIYGTTLFSAARDAALHLKEQSAPGDRIAVLGSEPEIYFYSQRLSATGFIYTYPLLEHGDYAPGLQQQMIGEIEAAHPKFMLFVNSHYSWAYSPGAATAIFDWANAYAQAHYRLSGYVDFSAMKELYPYRWKAPAQYPGGQWSSAKSVFLENFMTLELQERKPEL